MRIFFSLKRLLVAMGYPDNLPDHVKLAEAKTRRLPGAEGYAVKDQDGAIEKHVEPHPITFCHDETYFMSSVMHIPNFASSRIPFSDALAAELRDILETIPVQRRLAGKEFLGCMIFSDVCGQDQNQLF